MFMYNYVYDIINNKIESKNRIKIVFQYKIEIFYLNLCNLKTNGSLTFRIS